MVGVILIELVKSPGMVKEVRCSNLLTKVGINNSNNALKLDSSYNQRSKQIKSY